MKSTHVLTIIIVSCVASALASGCDFWTKDNILGPDNPPGNGNEIDSTTVSFLSDIMPIFNARCIVCHGNQGGLNITTYNTLMAGGNSGAAVIPDNGAGSLLVKRIDGTIPPQMPVGAPPLSNEEILLIKTWIDEGALNN